jgi:hypothetical protein
MRRLAAVLLIASASYVAFATPVAAQPDTSLNREVSGPFAGSTFLDFFTRDCGFPVEQLLDGTYQTQKGQSGSFHIEVCPTFSPEGSQAVGTFTLTTPHGATLSGTVTGVYGINAPSSLPFETAATGTKSLQQAIGTIEMDGIWQFDGNLISGTLAGSLER